MRPAGQKSVVVVEELVRPPIERRSGMDAIVHIGVIVPADVHYEAFNEPLAPENVKFGGVAGRDLSQGRIPPGRVSHGITGDFRRFHCEDECRRLSNLVDIGENGRVTRTADFSLNMTSSIYQHRQRAHCPPE